MTNSVLDIPYKTLCMAFDKLANCLFYDKNATIATSTFYCSLCESSYWLFDSKFCIQRQYFSVLCAVYEPDKEQCLRCTDEAFLDGSGLCLRKPSGFPGCEGYTDLETCEYCQPGFYLSGNACIKIAEANLI